ncbi:hypothetical protein [Fodinibius halophilus]
MIGTKDEIDTGKKVSEQFRKLFISYAQAINKQERRTGSLFQKNFKRKKVETQTQLTWLLYYIHRNPIHHGLDNQLDYRWSSYNALASQKMTYLDRESVHGWFGGRTAFINFHQQNKEIDIKKLQDELN